MRTRAAWLVSLSLLVTSTGRAQSAHPLFGVGFALAVPNGTYHSDVSGEGFDTGFLGAILVGVRLPKAPVVFRVAGSYSENGANEQLKTDLSNRIGQPTDAKFHLVGAMFDVAYEFGKSFRRVYLLGGGGPYRVQSSVTSGGVTADTSETNFGWNVGGGITWDVSNSGIFVEARYVHIAGAFGAPAVTFMPLEAGIRFGGH